MLMPRFTTRCTGNQLPSPFLISGSMSTSPRRSNVRRFCPCGIGRRGGRFGRPAVEVHLTHLARARLVVEREVPYGRAAQLHRTERRALPQHTEIESLVRQPDRNTVLDFGSTGVADGRTVVVVDHAVAVHVFVDYIARLYGAPDSEPAAAVHGVQAIGFVLVGDEVIEDVAEILTRRPVW